MFKKHIMKTINLSPDDIFVAHQDYQIQFEVGNIIRMNTVCIFFCEEGMAEIEVDFTPYKIEKNSQLILIDKRMFKCVSQSTPFICSYICFSADIYRELTLRLPPSFTDFLITYPYVKITKEQANNCRGMVRSMERFYNDHNNCYREQIFKNLIQAFLLDVYDKTHMHFQAPIGKMSRQEELFKEFIHLLHQYCRKEREVNFYADQLCITSRYLSELVKNVTHITAKTIINQHVIREIKMELNSSNASIQEIAFKMNFPNQSLLSRFFKKHTGITPQAFRNKE